MELGAKRQLPNTATVGARGCSPQQVEGEKDGIPAPE
jgi:hypothetical protein